MLPAKLKSQPPKDNRQVDKAEQILRGAMQEFLQRGYAGTSMDKVAQAAGVSKQTLYSYFQDKEKLFMALVEQMAQRRFQLVFGSVTLQGEPEIVLRKLATSLLEQIISDQEYLAFMRLVIGESGRLPELGQSFVRNIAQPGTKMISHYLAEHTDLSDPEETASVFLGTLLHFIMTQEIMHGKTVMPRSRDRLIDNLIGLIL